MKAAQATQGSVRPWAAPAEPRTRVIGTRRREKDQNPRGLSLVPMGRRLRTHGGCVGDGRWPARRDSRIKATCRPRSAVPRWLACGRVNRLVRTVARRRAVYRSNHATRRSINDRDAALGDRRPRPVGVAGPACAQLGDQRPGAADVQPSELDVMAASQDAAIYHRPWTKVRDRRGVPSGSHLIATLARPPRGTLCAPGRKGPICPSSSSSR